MLRLDVQLGDFGNRKTPLIKGISCSRAFGYDTRLQFFEENDQAM